MTIRAEEIVVCAYNVSIHFYFHTYVFSMCTYLNLRLEIWECTHFLNERLISDLCTGEDNRRCGKKVYWASEQHDFLNLSQHILYTEKQIIILWTAVWKDETVIFRYHSCQHQAFRSEMVTLPNKEVINIRLPMSNCTCARPKTNKLPSEIH